MKKHISIIKALIILPCGCGFYRGNGINGVHDREKQNIINTAGVIRVTRPGYLLTGRVVYERRMSGDVDLVVVGVSNSIARPIHILIFNQGLTLLGHEYNITAERWRWMILNAFHNRQNQGMAQPTKK